MHIKLYLVGRRSPDPRWSRAVLRLVGREDLAAMQNMDNDLSYRSFLIYSLFPLCPSLVHSHFSVFIKTDSRFCGYMKKYREWSVIQVLSYFFSPSSLSVSVTISHFSVYIKTDCRSCGYKKYIENGQICDLNNNSTI